MSQVSPLSGQHCGRIIPAPPPRPPPTSPSPPSLLSELALYCLLSCPLSSPLFFSALLFPPLFLLRLSVRQSLTRPLNIPDASNIAPAEAAKMCATPATRKRDAQQPLLPLRQPLLRLRQSRALDDVRQRRRRAHRSKTEKASAASVAWDRSTSVGCRFAVATPAVDQRRTV